MLTSVTSSTDLPAPRPVAAALPAPAAPWPIERGRPGHDDAVRRLGRVALGLEAHRWLLAASNILAAALFVVGCVAFYWPTLGAASVTLFLLGSLLFLVSALGSALLDHRPGHRR